MSQLLVEGKRDKRLLSAVLRDRIDHVEFVPNGRTQLPQRTIYGQSQGIATRCLRDRDFDFTVPEAGVAEWRVERFAKEPVGVGWYWRRVEIENYLLDPLIQAAACAKLTWWDLGAYRQALAATCRALRYHVAARDTLATLRRQLPPGYRLSDRPREWYQSWVCAPPSALAARTAVERAVLGYTDAVRLGTGADRLTELWTAAVQAVDVVDWDDATQALVHFPGKDLAQALDPWLKQRSGGTESGDRLLERASLWIQDHPAEALDLLPDWQDLCHFLAP